MPISSGPIGLTRTYGESHVTWNQPGLRTHSNISDIHVVDRPHGAGVNRDVNILFGHSQLIPTFTLQPEEEVKEQEYYYLDPSQAPAPRANKSPEEKNDNRVRFASQQQQYGVDGSPIRAEGDTTRRLGLNKESPKWNNFMNKSTDPIRPIGSRPPLQLKRGPPSTSRSRSRSPTGKNKPSSRPPHNLSSSLAWSPTSSARALRQRAAGLELDAGARGDIESGRYHSPHVKDLERTRSYVRALDEELRANAEAAAAAELKANQAVNIASAEKARRKDKEWNREQMVGVHVRAVGMERKWHGPQGMERINGLYDPQRDVNTTSTSILQDSLRSLSDSTLLQNAEASESEMLNRSQVLHSPKSSLSSSNVRYPRSQEEQKDSMPDKNVDLGFYGSGTRRHEEALGGKQLLKSRAWPRDPIGNITGSRPTTIGAGVVNSTRSVEQAHGVNTSTTSARIRAQESGEVPNDLNASFGRAHRIGTSSSPQTSARKSKSASNQFLLNPSNLSSSWTETPNTSAIKKKPMDFRLMPNQSAPPSQKKLRPASAGPNASTLPSEPLQQQQQQSSTLNQSTSQPNFHTNNFNTSSSALLNNSVTAASAEAQRVHAIKYNPEGSLRIHPRNFADEFLRENGINVSSGQGGLGDSSSAGDLNLTATTGQIMQPPLRSAHGIEGNGSILDLAPALRAREKAPWKYGGAKQTRRHDRKVKTAEDLVLIEAQKKRLPSSHTRPASAPAHRIGHDVSGGPGFLVGKTSLKPSIHLAGGRHIVGRTRVTPRVNLTDQDWSYLKKKEKAVRARVYSASQRGPQDPKPHNTSVIEEAMALERAQRRERELVAREREWRQQQIWLHEKKKGMDKIAAKKATEVRHMPPRPARESPKKEDNSHISAGAGGVAKPWGSSLIVPAYLESMQRIPHDIDIETEVRGKDSLARKQELLARQQKADANVSHTLDWNSSKHHLTDGDIMTNPFLDETEEPEPDPSNLALDRAALEREELEEFLKVRGGADGLAADQEERERKAIRAQIIADSLANAEIARSRAQAAEHENEIREEEAKLQQKQQQTEEAAKERRGIKMNKQAVNLSFTSSPKAAAESSSANATSTSVHEPFGLSSLQIAQSYDRRLKDMITFLRKRHPYMSEHERQTKAKAKAKELIEQELARMDAPRRQPQQADWFSEYQAGYVESDPENEHKYSSATAAPTTSSSASGPVNPFRAQREADQHQAELDALKRAADEAKERYERMKQQATESHQI